MAHNTEQDSSNSASYVGACSRLIRYAAYFSDIGESFRPQIKQCLVQGTYAISWTYVAGDVAYDGHKKYQNGSRGPNLYLHIAERTMFQSFASMILPALTIHTVVDMTKKHIFDKLCHPKYIKKWGPTGCGVAVIPFLPFIFDHPVEHVCHNVFSQIRQVYNVPEN